MKGYKTLIALSIIFILPIIFFWRIVLLGETLFAGDMITLNYPLRVFVRECLKENIIPLWCPYLSYGFPLLGEGQMGVFYPLNILLFTIFEPNFAYNYSVILHFFLAGLFMFIYLQTIMLDRYSALFASITFMFSGVFITHLTYFNMLTIYVWLPLILYFIEMFFRNRSLTYIIFIGVIFGIQFLGGFPQISLQILLVLPIYFLFKIFTFSNKKENLKLFLNLFIIFLIGGGIYAIQLFPTYELLKESYRSVPFPYNEWVLASLSLPQLITFILPDFWGNPFKGIYIGDWNYIDLCGYLGIIPLILGIIAIVLRRDKYTFLFLGICLLGLLLAFGKYNPFYNLLYHIPILSGFRYPARYLYLYTFSVSILAGLGLNYLLNISNKVIQKRLIRIVTFMAICFGLLGIFFFIQTLLENLLDKKEYLYSIRIKDLSLFIIISIFSFTFLILYIKHKITSSIFAILSIILLIVNIFIYWLEFNPTVKKSILTSIPESVNFLKKDKEVYRITTYMWKRKYKDPIARSNISKLKPFEEKIIGFKESLCPNIGVLYKISSIDIFQSLPLIRYKEFTQILNLNLFSLANGKYIITTKDIHLPHYPLVFSNEVIKIFENKYCLPRAFFVQKARVVKDRQKILDLLTSKDFDPKKEVILEEEIQCKIQNTTIPKMQNVKIIDYQPNWVTINTSCSHNGFLFLSDTYYPGWQAYIDGKKTKIYRANFLFRAILLPKGSHKVEFVFSPLSFKIGLWGTLLTIIFIFIAIIFKGSDLKKRRKLCQE